MGSLSDGALRPENRQRDLPYGNRTSGNDCGAIAFHRAHTINKKATRLHAPIPFVVMPLFALANAGVRLVDGVGVALHSPVTVGVVLGLLLGKPVGIMLSSASAVRIGVAELPAGITWLHVLGVSWLGGIGFTMSLFIVEDWLSRTALNLSWQRSGGVVAGIALANWSVRHTPIHHRRGEA